MTRPVIARHWTPRLGTTPDFENTYGYDNFNQMTSVIQQSQSGAGANAVAFKQVGLGYNLAGQLTTISRFNHAVEDPNDPSIVVSASGGTLAQSIYGYDGAGRLQSIGQSLAGAAHNSTLSWGYDTLNRVTSFTNTADSSTAIIYNYDNTNQLLGSTAITGVAAQSYAYDPNGNRITTNGVSSTIGAGNRLLSDGTYTYSYDNEGNMIARSGGGTTRIFTYDYRNRLIEVADYILGNTTPTQDIHYAYDVFDRRVERQQTTTEVDGGEGNTTSNTTDEHYVYDGDHVVLSFLGNDGGAPALKNRYLYGAAVDQVLAQEDLWFGAPHPLLWALADNEGTIRDVVNGTGALVSHYQYDAFGNVLSGDTSLGRYFYTGRELDSATGLQYNRERWYDPKLARWVSQDPIGLSVDSNPYRYVRNNPTGAIDPMGLAEVSIQADAFIPDAWIWLGGPFLQLKGDNRSTMLTPPGVSQSRVTSRITIETNKCVSDDPLLFHTHIVAPSTRSLFGIQQTALGTANGHETATRTGPRSVRVEIKVSAYLPQVLVPGAPHIDYKYTVNVSEDCNGVVHYSVSGAHDGFPAYELFVGGSLVHRSRPAQIGGYNNPFALFGDSDYTVEPEEGTLPDNSPPPLIITFPLNGLGD